MPDPIRILFASACPPAEVRIRVDREFADLQEIVRASSGKLELLPPLTAASFEVLQRGLLESKCDIVHISAHGTENALVFERHSSREEVDSSILTEILADKSDTLRCVVLNACYSAKWFVRPMAPEMVLMNGSVDDEGALGFSRGFYEGLAAGVSIASAYKAGKLRGKQRTKGHFDPRLTSSNRGTMVVRTFQHYETNLEPYEFPHDLSAHCSENHPIDWEAVGSEVQEFARKPDLRARLAQQPYHLRLACHASVAFLLGREFGPMAPVHPVQNGYPPVLWEVDPSAVSDDPGWTSTELGDPTASNLAFAISLAHPIGLDVVRHFERLGVAARILEFSVPGPDVATIRDGNHAAKLARDLQNELVSIGLAPGQPLHLFMSAPNGFAFLLGKRGRAGLGMIQLYEFDPGTRTYAPSILAR